MPAVPAVVLGPGPLPRFDLASERPDRDWDWVELGECDSGRDGQSGWAGDEGEEGEVGLLALGLSLRPWSNRVCTCACGSSAVLGREVLEMVLPSQNDLNIAVG